MGLAIGFLAFWAAVHVGEWLHRQISYWILVAKFKECYLETQEYADKGMVLNFQAGARRLRIIQAEMEKHL